MSPLSQVSIDLLPEVARRLNLALLCRSNESAFILMQEPPEWFGQIFGNGNDNGEFHLEQVSIFLESFLVDAANHWASERPEPLKSGVWHEFDKHDREHYLEATSLYVSGHCILIVESLGHDYEVRVQLFQKARNFVLQNQSLDYELQKNDVLLHFLSGELAPSMQRVSRMLADGKAAGGLNAEALSELSKQVAKQDILLDTFLRGFSSEIVAMQHVSRDYSSAPDITEVIRTLVKSELESFISRSVGLSMDSTVPSNESTKVVSHRGRLEKVVGSLMHFTLRRAPEGASVNIQVHSHGEDWILTEIHESVASLGQEGEAIFDHLLTEEPMVRRAALSLYFCKLTIDRWGGEIGYRHAGDSGCWWFRLRRVKASTP